MYKALIVDDERIIRQGIRMAIPWERLGISQVFQAASGQEALEIFKEEKPHIMITDIRMTEVTGLELIAQIREINEDTKIIVLTGYDSFDYARQCLRMKVEEFLLKPVDEDHLIETVEKQVRVLDESKEREVAEKHMHRVLGVTAQFDTDTMMNDLILNREIQEDVLDGYCSAYGHDKKSLMKIGVFIPSICGDGRCDEENESFTKITMKSLLISVVDARNKGITFESNNGYLVSAVFVPEKSDELDDLIMDSVSLLQEECTIRVKVVLGSNVEGFRQLHISYNEALMILEHGTDDYHTVIQKSDTKSRVEMFREIFEEFKSFMCANVGNTDKVLRAFESFRTAIESYNISDPYARKCCFELASSVNFAYMVDSGDSTGDTVNSLMNALMSAKGVEACDITRKFLENLLEGSDGDDNEIITKTKRYINEHLAEDISVTYIAENFYLTPNYFSRLFKRVTGEGCNEYIVRKRIEQAKCLLETTNYKSGQIASMVGYRDTNYFSLAFKKYVGESPTQYRKNIREKM